jgi:hypothetical protein
LKWAAFATGALGGVVVAAVVLAAVGAVSAKIAAGVLQLLGIGLTVLGVAVVRSWLERAADKAAEGKRGLDRWWALRREQLRRWWAHRRRRPVVVHVSAHDSARVTDSASVTLTRYRVDREAVSDRDWLAHLDDRVYGLVDQVDKLEKARMTDRAAWSRRLADQRDELRAQMFAATRQGWELIVSGLVCSAVGTALGIAT